MDFFFLKNKLISFTKFSYLFQKYERWSKLECYEFKYFYSFFLIFNTYAFLQSVCNFISLYYPEFLGTIRKMNIRQRSNPLSPNRSNSVTKVVSDRLCDRKNFLRKLQIVTTLGRGFFNRITKNNEIYSATSFKNQYC